jgi:hypothetical protein
VNVLVALLVVLSLTVIASWLLSWPILGSWIAISRLVALKGRTWSRYTPAIVMSPVLVGLFVTMAILIPGDPHLGHVVACHCDLSNPGWLHLCPVHATTATPILLVLAAPTLLLLFRPVLVLQRLHSGLGQFAHLLVNKHEEGTIHLLDLGLPLVCTSGLFRPFVLADRQYWSGVDTSSRRVIEAHESAHVQRRDPLVRFWLAMWTAFSCRTLADSVMRDWETHAELCADRHAASMVGDPLLVAEVLVRQRRVQAQVALPALPWSASSLELRIRTLLKNADRTSAPRSDLDLRWVVVAAFTSSLVVLLNPWLHHGIEHLINSL